MPSGRAMRRGVVASALLAPALLASLLASPATASGTQAGPAAGWARIPAASAATVEIRRAVCDNASVAGRIWWCEAKDIGTQDSVRGGLIRGRAEDGLAPTNPAGVVLNDPEINAVYELLGDVAIYYAEVHGVDLTELIGFGPSDGSVPRVLSATVNACVPNSFDCDTVNAYWLGPDTIPDDWQGQFVGGATSFTRGVARFKDVVAHELAHGVIEALTPLRYGGESGAVTEHLADVFGELADLYKVDENEAPNEDINRRWMIGEGRQWFRTQDFLRSMADPALPRVTSRMVGQGSSCGGQQPDRMTHPCWDTDPLNSNNGGMHTNMGVGNKAAYLVAEGGIFNGQVITGAGIDLMGRIWFNVMAADMLRERDGYFEFGQALMRSCRDLVRRGVTTAATCDRSLAPAIIATEMTQREMLADIPSFAPRGRSTEVVVQVGTLAAEPRALARQSVTVQRWDSRSNTWRFMARGTTDAFGEASFGVTFQSTTRVRVRLDGADGTPALYSVGRVRVVG